MTEERITETSTPNGNTHTHTTVITDQPASGGGMKWIGLMVLVVVGIGAFFLFSQMSDAAAQVGDAAGQVGAAAEQAIETVTE